MHLLLRIWINPAGAMSAILDRGSLLFATLALLASTAFVNMRLPIGFIMLPILLAAVYVPGLLMLGSIVGRLGGIGMLLHRDSSAMLTCAAMAMAAAEIPFALMLWV